jgi:hypothetical protein
MYLCTSTMYYLLGYIKNLFSLNNHVRLIALLLYC